MTTMTHDEISDVFSSYDLERLNVYKNRRGNINCIEIGVFGGTVCTKFPEVGYFNYIQNLRKVRFEISMQSRISTKRII